MPSLIACWAAVDGGPHDVDVPNLQRDGVRAAA